MSKSLSIDYVRTFIEDCGYSLLSDYKNMDSPIIIRCPYGHTYTPTFGNFRRGNRCPYCYGNVKHTIEYIRSKFEEVGYKLLSDTYENEKKKLKFKCDMGHVGEISWGKFRMGRRCSRCAGNSSKTIEEIREVFLSRGYKLLSTDYKNCYTKLHFICPEGHAGEIQWSDFQQGKGCSICGGTKKKTYEHIKEQFEKEGYTLLSEEYMNWRTPLWFICPNGHKHKITWNMFQQGQRCSKCSSRVSKVSQEWLDSIDIPVCNREKYKVIEGKRFYFDGYDPTTKTVYEFLGDYYHGNPRKYSQEDFFSWNKKITFGDKYYKTLQKFEKLKVTGYSVFYVWENDYIQGKKGQYFDGEVL